MHGAQNAPLEEQTGQRHVRESSFDGFASNQQVHLPASRIVLIRLVHKNPCAQLRAAYTASAAAARWA
eukprot:2606754-Pleurochrysis_carterae.AAC.4